MSAKRFVVIWEDDDIGLYDELGVSNLFDMADCHGVDFRVYYPHKGELVPVILGGSERHSWDPEVLTFASAPLLISVGGESLEVGQVSYSNH